VRSVFGDIILVFIMIGVFSAIGLRGLILIFIGGGIGFAIGSAQNLGWGIFGAVLGGLIGIYFGQMMSKAD
jgi:hypothetical protein